MYIYNICDVEYVMTSHILKFVDSSKTQKSKYLKKKTLLFLQIKTSFITH